MGPRLALVLGALVLVAAPARAAAPDTLRVDTPGLDARLLLMVYEQQAPLATLLFRAADASSTPAFVAAVPAAWVATWALGADPAPALRLTLAEGTTGAVVWLTKRAVRRPRPYLVEPGVESRSAVYRPGGRASWSFPSGHAALAFAVATSASLSAPAWYVVVPAVGWAAAVSASRVWLGVHYPSDVLAGAVLGAGLAAAAHVLVATETVATETVAPAAAPAAALPVVFLRVPIP